MNKKFSHYLILLLFLFFTVSGKIAIAQNLNGQWRGGFVSSGGVIDRSTEYVLDLNIKGAVISGYSYTYFIIMGKRCYVICKLKRNHDKNSKSLVVTEFEKVKSNTPPDFRDCFQTHILTFYKQDGNEILKGNWKPASPTDNCGIGMTELERRTLVKVVPKNPPQGSVAKTTTPTRGAGNPSKTTTTRPKTSTKTSPPVAKTKTPANQGPSNSGKTAKQANPVPKEDINKKYSESKPVTIDQNLPSIEKPAAPATINGTVVKSYENRGIQVIKTIEVDSPTFKVDLYDNGTIDGDTVSLYFNGKLVVSRQRLSAKPITLNIKIDPKKENNDLVMFAENLGSIPPNTSLMIVTVGDKRYEVNITSTEQTSGTVRFKMRDD